MDGGHRNRIEANPHRRQAAGHARGRLRIATGPLARVLATGLMLTPVLARGQAIVDGDVRFERSSSSFDATPAGNLLGVAANLASDQLFETGWAYRVGGDTREFFFPLPATQNYSGNTSTLIWTDVAGRGLLGARETVRVTDLDGAGGASPSGLLEMTMEVTNISASVLNVGLFHLVDLDIAGSGAGDTVALLRPGPNPTIGISEAAVSAQYRGLNANRWQVLSYNSGNGIGGLLNDTSLTTLANNGAPGGPMDFTGGMQWADRPLQPGASFSVSVTIAVNASVTQPELFVIKSNDVEGVTTLDGLFAWTLQMINAQHSPTVTFSPGQILLRDQLPATGLVYDTALVTSVGGVTGTVDCTVAGADLVCSAATAVSIPGGASVQVMLPAGPTIAGTFSNPRAGGTCLIDPGNHVSEEVETNNSCADTVTVIGPGVFADGFETPMAERSQ